MVRPDEVSERSIHPLLSCHVPHHPARIRDADVLFPSDPTWPYVTRSVILFLNKIDLFKEKLPRSAIEPFFPDYTGGPDFKSACDYFSMRFTSLNQSPSKQVYVHLTCEFSLPASRDEDGVSGVFFFFIWGRLLTAWGFVQVLRIRRRSSSSCLQ